MPSKLKKTTKRKRKRFQKTEPSELQKSARERNLGKGKVSSVIGLLTHMVEDGEIRLLPMEKSRLLNAKQFLVNTFMSWDNSTDSILQTARRSKE